MKRTILILAAALTISALPLAAAPRELSDAEMDDVHAGNSPALEADEEVELTPVTTTTITDYSQHSVSLSDNAQQNLTSLVNIVAVNSAVQVLMNVNVSIDSTVGSVTQGNNGSQVQ